MRRIETLGSWGEIWQNLILDRITAEPRKMKTQAAKNTHLQNLLLNLAWILYHNFVPHTALDLHQTPNMTLI